MKDLFEYIDQKKDGLIDMTEWMNIFNRFEYQGSVTVSNEPQASIGGSADMKITSARGGQRLSTAPPLSRSAMMKRTNDKRIALTKDSEGGTSAREDMTTLPAQLVGSEKSKSKEFDDALVAIGKNRKFLLEMFASLEARRIAVTFESVKAVIR